MYTLEMCFRIQSFTKEETWWKEEKNAQKETKEEGQHRGENPMHTLLTFFFFCINACIYVWPLLIVCECCVCVRKCRTFYVICNLTYSGHFGRKCSFASMSSFTGWFSERILQHSCWKFLYRKISIFPRGASYTFFLKWLIFDVIFEK